MYQILVVDDEVAIAEGICYLLRRGVPECSIIGFANDGTSGYAMAKKHQPDIVITDVRMIEMDGFEMIEKLRQDGFRGRFVILSGYADFEYAKKAIGLGVEDYITKPIEEEELFLVIQTVLASIVDEVNKRESVQCLEQKVETYGQSIKAYVLKEMIVTNMTIKDEEKNRLKQHGFPTMWKQYCCMVFELSEESTKRQSETFWLFLRERGEQNNHTDVCVEMIRLSNRQVVMIYCTKGKVDYRTIVFETGKLRWETEQATEVPISTGIGLIGHDMNAIRKSFEEARSALSYKVMKGPSSVIAYNDIVNMAMQPVLMEEADIKRLEVCIDQMDDAGSSEIVEEIFMKISRNYNGSLKDIQVMSLSLILLGIRKMPFMQIQINEYLGSNILSLESISKFTTLEQLKNWVINILKGMNELMLKQTFPEKRDVIEEVKTFLSKNFSQEINLTTISERFYINPNYFSHLFKKRTGMTYQNYLKNLRIARARKLLDETDLKIYEICELAGYGDATHFSKVFEREVGVKPSEYRNEKL